MRPAPSSTDNGSSTAACGLQDRSDLNWLDKAAWNLCEIISGIGNAEGCWIPMHSGQAKNDNQAAFRPGASEGVLH